MIFCDPFLGFSRPQRSLRACLPLAYCLFYLNRSLIVPAAHPKGTLCVFAIFICSSRMKQPLTLQLVAVPTASFRRVVPTSADEPKGPNVWSSESPFRDLWSREPHTPCIIPYIAYNCQKICFMKSLNILLSGI